MNFVFRFITSLIIWVYSYGAAELFLKNRDMSILMAYGVIVFLITNLINNLINPYYLKKE